mmetsp:Transcript_2071/g.4363  ORF Transcript_2071/g.4363 Transcript_2071/m.4363 type:complete len:372 (-) Transcript_2071:579-1694(-)
MHANKDTPCIHQTGNERHRQIQARRIEGRLPEREVKEREMKKETSSEGEINRCPSSQPKSQQQPNERCRPARDEDRFSPRRGHKAKAHEAQHAERKQYDSECNPPRFHRVNHLMTQEGKGKPPPFPFSVTEQTEKRRGERKGPLALSHSFRVPPSRNGSGRLLAGVTPCAEFFVVAHRVALARLALQTLTKVLTDALGTTVAGFLVHTEETSAADFTHVAPVPVLAHVFNLALLAPTALSAMGAETLPPTVLALRPLSVVLTNTAAPTLPALAPLTTVLANTLPPTLLAQVSLSAVIANALPPTLPAPPPLLAVLTAAATALLLTQHPDETVNTEVPLIGGNCPLLSLTTHSPHPGHPLNTGELLLLLLRL